jgi:hypothetical protein
MNEITNIVIVDSKHWREENLMNEQNVHLLAITIVQNFFEMLYILNVHSYTITTSLVYSEKLT